MDQNEAILNETAGSAIAAFTLAQFAFWSLINTGLLDKQAAERMLTQGIEANRQGGPANQSAAQKLQGVLDNVRAYQKPPAH